MAEKLIYKRLKMVFLQQAGQWLPGKSILFLYKDPAQNAAAKKIREIVLQICKSLCTECGDAKKYGKWFCRFAEVFAQNAKSTKNTGNGFADLQKSLQ